MQDCRLLIHCTLLRVLPFYRLPESVPHSWYHWYPTMHCSRLAHKQHNAIARTGITVLLYSVVSVTHVFTLHSSKHSYTHTEENRERSARECTALTPTIPCARMGCGIKDASLQSECAVVHYTLCREPFWKQENVTPTPDTQVGSSSRVWVKFVKSHLSHQNDRLEH